jgi:alpha-L-rhamnosidase
MSAIENAVHPFAPGKLQTEYLENPLGIDAHWPRLGWQSTSSRRGAMQSAYQVQAAADPAQFASPLWDSGKVASDRSQGIEYAGPQLASRQRLYWRVRVWDQDDNASGWSQPAWWEMGLLEEQDWQAEWIEPDWDEDPQAFHPCPYLRRSFNLDAPVRSAQLYITAHGLYEAWLNGERVGDQVFTPGYTPYDLMLQYQVYDVTAMLQEGENVIGAILGDGWYRGKVYGVGDRNVYGERLGLLAMLVVETGQGQQVRIGSDGEWKAATGPILKSDMKDGETYDARLEMPGWCRASFDDSTWKDVRVVQHPKDHLVASMGAPVRRKETFTPSLIVTPNGESVLDFGQNLAGVVHFKVSGPRGATLLLHHGETLDQDGNFTVKHLVLGKAPDAEKNPFQLVRYILKGEGGEEYEPRFTVHGFRYAKVEGYPGEIDPDDFYSVAIYSDMPPTGAFECSDPLITRLHTNVEWSMKSNFLDLPTDCPQRERAGWTGDAQVFAPSAAFLMDTRAFFRKWLRELAIEQFPNGKMGNFVPNPYRMETAGGALTKFLLATDGSAGWGDAATFIPWELYRAYGDLQFLESQYESMAAWVEYVKGRAGHTNRVRKLSPGFLFNERRRARRQLIWDTNYHWGEWLEPGEGSAVKLMSGVIKRFLFGAPVVATAYYAHSTRILARTAELLARTAELLGRAEEAAEYHDLADQITAAYIAEFIGPDGRIEPDRQASYVRVLAFDLAPEDLKPAIVDHLVRLVRASRHVGTGFLSTVFLCEVLAEHGHAEIAYDLLTQTGIPSWLYPVTKGATTIWETWEGIDETGKPNLSLNHYSPGAVINFLHRVVAGIQAAEPGYKRIAIHPLPGGGLTSAKASYESVYGRIASAWERNDGRMRLDVNIPANTRAVVTLPGAALEQVTESGVPLANAEGIGTPIQQGTDVQLPVGSGVYRFEYPVQEETA